MTLDCHCPGSKWFFTGLLTTVVLAVLCGPARALASPSGSGVGQFAQGVPVYWPYHVLLMSTGFVLLVAGFIIARFHKTRNWYKTHAILEGCGGACIVAGVCVGIYMVARSGLPHLQNTHEILGVTTVLLVITTIALGYSIKRVITAAKKIVRPGHRWLGRIVIVLMAITIIFGIFMLSLILGR